MEDQNQLPLFSADLIQRLDQQYPEQCPSPRQSNDMATVWAYSGKRELIRDLLSQLRHIEEG